MRLQLLGLLPALLFSALAYLGLSETAGWRVLYCWVGLGLGWCGSVGGFLFACLLLAGGPLAIMDRRVQD